MFRSKSRDTTKTPTVSKADAARGGAEGDGLEHDLDYWIASGFLTLPRKDERQAEADAAHAAATATPDGRPAPA